MNWYIGQEIVCIKTHSKGYVERGKIYTIKVLQKGHCNCTDILVDVGITTTIAIHFCSSCDIMWGNKTNAYWFSERLFAPLEYNQQAIDELLEQPCEV